jgi:trimethylamine monooxygenase
MVKETEYSTFKVTVEELIEGTMYSEIFDYLVVALVHFSSLNAPRHPGFDTFNGCILNSHNFQNAQEFKGKSILLLGTSYSAEDIGLQCCKCWGAKSITVSHPTSPMGYDLPMNWQEVRKTKDVDAIILCPGYTHYIPFMTNKLQMVCPNVLMTPMLYKGVALINNPKIFYLGMQDQWYSFKMFDAQAWCTPDAILG